MRRMIGFMDSNEPKSRIHTCRTFFDKLDVEDHIIKGFAYDHRSIVKGASSYDQPITLIEMDSGRKVRFSIHFGEAKKEERAAIYECI